MWSFSPQWRPGEEKPARHRVRSSEAVSPENKEAEQRTQARRQWHAVNRRAGAHITVSLIRPLRCRFSDRNHTGLVHPTPARAKEKILALNLFFAAWALSL
jgi:hypothetical protein